MKRLILIYICFILLLSIHSVISKDVIRIAFGSCNKQTRPQEHWKKIEDSKPNAFIWTGDAVYPTCNTTQCLKDAYLVQRSRPEYAHFLQRVKVVDGIYDDHDFGENDGGKSFPNRETSRQLFLDFLGVETNSPRRTRQGAYTSLDLTSKNGHSVKVIILDTRYNRDDLAMASPISFHSHRLPLYVFGAITRFISSSFGLLNKEGDILGEEQWKWLEEELQNSTADANVIVSSIQVLTTQPIVESWGHFPSAQRRLLKVIESSAANGVIFVSGDVHFGELMGDGETSLVEMTSSGLTHSGFGLSKFPFLEDILMRSQSQVLDRFASPFRRALNELLDRVGMGRNVMRLSRTPLLLKKNFGIIDFIFPSPEDTDKISRATLRVSSLELNIQPLVVDVILDASKGSNQQKARNTLALLRPLGGGKRPLAMVGIILSLISTIIFPIILCTLKPPKPSMKIKKEQ